MAFIQIIEIKTSKQDEIMALADKWQAATEGQRKAQRVTITADRDRPGTYLQIVEFPSHEEAMANSALPATSEFAGQLAALCDEPPSFRNLDVQDVRQL